MDFSITIQNKLNIMNKKKFKNRTYFFHKAFICTGNKTVRFSFNQHFTLPILYLPLQMLTRDVTYSDVRVM